MRKAKPIAVSLLLACLLAAFTTSVMAAGEDEGLWTPGETYIAVVRHNTPENVDSLFASGVGYAPHELIFVEPPDYENQSAAWIVLPEGSDVAEAYFDCGIRVTVAESWMHDGAVIVVPESMEVIGQMVYGRVLHYGDKAIVLDLVNGPKAMLAASPYQYAIPEDTPVYGEVVVGESAELVVDADENALYIKRSNG